MTTNYFLLWILLSLAAYRLTRVLVADTITDWFRDMLHERAYPNNAPRSFWHDKMYQLFTCQWCWGFWVTWFVFSWAWFLLDIPLVLVQGLAASVVVGTLGTYLDD